MSPDRLISSGTKSFADVHLTLGSKRGKVVNVALITPRSITAMYGCRLSRVAEAG